MTSLQNMVFTRQNDPWIDKTIADQLSKVLKVILFNLDDVQTVILNGSFGKGEGSVVKVDGTIFPMNDFDIIIVTRRPHFWADVHFDFEKRFACLPGFHFDTVLFWKPMLRFVAKKVQWYDIKFGSKILYGDANVLNMIRIKQNEALPVAEGFRLLFHRMAGLLEFFEPGFAKTGCSGQKAKLIVYQSIKAILACCESLLLLRKKWKLNTDERCEVFAGEFSNEFRRLMIDDPDLPAAVEMATRYKLFPRSISPMKDLDLWFSAQGHILHAIEFFWEEHKGLEISNGKDLAESILNDVDFSFYDFCQYHLRYLRDWRKIHPTTILLRTKPLNVLFAAAYLLLISVDANGEIDIEILEAAESIIQRLLPFESSNPRDSAIKWSVLRNRLFQTIKYIQ